MTFDENSSPFLSFLDYSYWLVKDLELAFRDAAMSTPDKKTARLKMFINWLVLQQENLLMLTAVLLWCHQLPFEW